MRCFAVLAALAVAAPASADQCAWIDQDVATQALAYLSEGAEWVAWCEPCGEAASRPAHVGHAEVRPVGGGRYHQVFIDDEGIDLAYVFVHDPERRGVRANLSKLVGCPSVKVSSTLPIPDARPVAMDVPVPSPCAQRWDTDSDGRPDAVTHYLYGPDRVLETLIRDDDADGQPDAVVQVTHDGVGRPTTATHDDNADGVVDRRLACDSAHCTTNWIPECTRHADCARNALGLIETMRIGNTVVTLDYECWSRDQGLWQYTAPAGLPASRR